MVETPARLATCLMVIFVTTPNLIEANEENEEIEMNSEPLNDSWRLCVIVNGTNNRLMQFFDFVNI